jgi:uncharacterized protein YutE (UPF0331/DUF86 family)
MVQPDVAGAKIARATTWLDDAEAILRRPSEEYDADARGRDLAAFYLFLAIQECIDLGAHWVADSGWQPPDEAAAVFDVLADRGAIPRSLADGLVAAAGLRNRIAHGYARVDHRRIRDEAPDGIGRLRAFLAVVARAAGL